MSKPTGFIDYERHDVINRDYKERLNDFSDMYKDIDEDERRRQGARCMDCGVPFCQSDYGCPVDNLIPEWNDLVRQGRWKEAYMRLRKTNNFPEYTGKVCPAPCESACVLAINESAVTIKDNEWSIIDRAYQEGWVTPCIPKTRSGMRVAIVGSGPAGLAAADQLNQRGHSVTVYERADRIGGLLMYGIPNMKLEKSLINKRNAIMEEEGVCFKSGVEIGIDISLAQLQQENHAVLLAIGATVPKDLALPGRELPGIHFAMDYLHAVTKSLLDSNFADGQYINTKGKNVIVIGSGDTGTDCIATAARQRARSLVNFGWRNTPQQGTHPDFPWPLVPKILKFDYAHKEVAADYGQDPRAYGILTKGFVGTDKLEGVKTVNIKWHKDAPLSQPRLEEIRGTEKIWPADVVFIALGYSGTETRLTKTLEVTPTNTIACPTQKYHTSTEGIFVAGDAYRGQSLIVWAIKEGREAAAQIEEYFAR